MAIFAFITDPIIEFRAMRLGRRAMEAFRAGDYGVSEELNRKALAIMERTFGDIEQTAVYTSNLAELFGAQGRLSEAAPFYERILQIARATVLEAESFGPEDPRLVEALNNLAKLNTEQEQYSEAEPVLQRLLAIREKTLGQNDPYIADTLANLANAYEKLSKHKEAEALYRRALSIYESHQLGTERPIVASILSSLAALLRSDGNTAEADRLVAQAEAILSKHSDLQPSDWLHPNTRGDESN